MSVDVTGMPAPYSAMDAVPTATPASVPGTLCPVCGTWTRIPQNLGGITEHAPRCPQFVTEAVRLILAQKRVVDAASDYLDAEDSETAHIRACDEREAALEGDEGQDHARCGELMEAAYAARTRLAAALDAVPAEALQ